MLEVMISECLEQSLGGRQEF